jgi:hypothetical protein
MRPPLRVIPSCHLNSPLLNFSALLCRQTLMLNWAVERGFGSSVKSWPSQGVGLIPFDRLRIVRTMRSDLSIAFTFIALWANLLRYRFQANFHAVFT